MSGWTPNSPTEQTEAIAKIYRDADELSAELKRDSQLRGDHDSRDCGVRWAEVHDG